MYHVFADGFEIPIFTSRYPEAAHARKERLVAEAAKIAADRRARNCDLPRMSSKTSRSAPSRISREREFTLPFDLGDALQFWQDRQAVNDDLDVSTNEDKLPDIDRGLRRW